MLKSKFLRLSTVLYILGLLLVVAITTALIAWRPISQKPADIGKIRVVAAENFWGSLVEQIGGKHIQVTSVVADPNADPHEFSIRTNTAKLFDSANYVVLNGAGYDNWGEKLLSSRHNAGPDKILIVANFLGKKTGDNPHFWYSPSYVSEVIDQIKTDLVNLDPDNSSYYQQQAKQLHQSLDDNQVIINNIRQHHQGTQIAATESAFEYLAEACGLRIISPTAFMAAVGEGGQPPTGSLIQFQQDLQTGRAKLLIYNSQTETPLTKSMRNLAATDRIPTVSFSEIIQPANLSYQSWMHNQLSELQAALNQGQSK